jgi:hypothetical protein
MRSFFGLLLVSVALYVTAQLAPPYLANLRLEEAIDDTARAFSRVLPPTEDEARARVVAEARALAIELDPRQVEVRRTEHETIVWADYTVRVRFPLYPLELHFQPASHNRQALPGF